MKKGDRKDLKIKFWLDIIGTTLTFLGLGGIAGYCDGQGKLLNALIVFIIGLSEVLWSYTRDSYH